MTRTVVALFDDMPTAQRAVEELVNNGFRRDDISLLVTDREEGARTATPTGVEESAGGAAAGAGIGGILGGVAGLLVGLGALAIPGVGPIIAAGPLAAALAGAGLGAAAGGLLGALVEAGIPEEAAGYYAEGIRRGGILVTVNAGDTMHSRAAEILNHHYPINIDARAAEWRNAGWMGDPLDTGVATEPAKPHSTSGGLQTTADYYVERGGISGGAEGTSYQETGDPTAGGTLGAPGTGRVEQTRSDVSATGSTGMSGGSGATGGSAITGTSKPAAGGTSRGSEGDLGESSGDPQGTSRRMDSEEHANTGSYGNRSGLDYTGAAGGTMGDSGAANHPSMRLGREEHSDSITTGAQTGGSWEGGLSTGSGREQMRDTELGHGGEGRSQFGPTPDQQAMTGARFGDTGPAGGESSGSEVSTSRTGQYGGGPSGQTDHGSRGEGSGATYTNANANRQERTFGTGGGGQAGSSTAFGGDPEWQSHYNETYRGGDTAYDRYEPAYQWGDLMANDTRYSGRNWFEVENDVRSDWERSHPDDAWQDFKEAIRHAWERVRNVPE